MEVRYTHPVGFQNVDLFVLLRLLKESLRILEVCICQVLCGDLTFMFWESSCVQYRRHATKFRISANEAKRRSSILNQIQ